VTPAPATAPRSRARKGGGAPAVTEPTASKKIDEALAEKEDKPEDKVLDLTTLARSRRTVKLPTKEKPEGEIFEIRLLDDFGVQQQQQILTWSRRYDKLYNRDDGRPDLSDGEADLMKHYLDSMFEEILDAPKTKKNQMGDSLRQRVVLVFSMAPALLRDERNAMEFRRALLGELIERGISSEDELLTVMNEMTDERQKEMNSILVS
jgi:hypothetical protein